MSRNKPLVLPEIFTGEKNWDEWADHFDSVATVNEWDDETKLKWLRVRLTGRAATAFRRLPETTRADFKEAVKAMRKRFEPESKKELYMAELQTRTKRRDEDWATLGDDLKSLADKAYPELQDEARELLALNQYLSQLDSPQIAFGVRQNKPKTVDDAVRLTLEVESYLRPRRPDRIAQVGEDDDETGVIAAAAKTPLDDTLKQLLRRIDRIEAELRTVQQSGVAKQQEGLGGERDEGPKWRRPRSRSKPLTCWNCGGEGHLSRSCTSPRKNEQQQQGNEKPSMPRAGHAREN